MPSWAYIRKLEPFKKLPIIILSGAPEAEVHKALAPYNDVFYLKKPPVLSDLHATMELALRLK